MWQRCVALHSKLQAAQIREHLPVCMAGVKPLTHNQNIYIYLVKSWA